MGREGREGETCGFRARVKEQSWCNVETRAANYLEDAGRLCLVDPLDEPEELLLVLDAVDRELAVVLHEELLELLDADPRKVVDIPASR